MMKYSNKNMKDTKYFTIHAWDESAVMATYSNDYMYKSNAEKAFNTLVASGKYHTIMMRIEDVTLRNEETEISSSSPFKQYKNGKITMF